MKDTNDQNILHAFTLAFDEMGDEALKRIVDAYAAFAKRNGGAIASPLHKIVLSENAFRDYRNQSYATDHDA